MDIRRFIYKHTYKRFILRPRRSFVIAPELNAQDVFLVSYPRSGNTWIRFIIANILVPDFHKTNSLRDLDKFVPDIYQGISRFFAGPKPRVVKTHQPYAFRHAQTDHGLYRRAIYIARHPFDVVRSYFHFQSHTWGDSPFIESDWETFVERFVQGSIRFGSWNEHVLSWLDRRPHIDMLVLRYEDVGSQCEDSIQKLASFLGRPATAARAEELSVVCSLDSMRAAEERGALTDNGYPMLRREKDRRKVSVELTDDMKVRISNRFAPAMTLLDYSIDHD